MIGTEFLPGQGLGNRLFCYVTARCAALEQGVEFGTAGQEYLHTDFLDLDPGRKITDISSFSRYEEKEERIYLPTCVHDMIHGCYVAGEDPNIRRLPDNTLIYGNLQAESYFADYREEICRWLAVRPEADSKEYTADDLCILNVRGGEYTDENVLFLRQKYWKDAIKQMRRENPDMRFMIITDDPAAAEKNLPGIPAFHFSPEKDYVTIKNARYVILSNSSFGFFPVYTGTEIRKVIAPKYWARHNVSDGYWASAQNIYSGFEYLGRDGRLYTTQQCREELQAYRMPGTSPFDPGDPMVEKVRKRQERALKLRKIQRKLERMAKIKLV